MFLKTFIAKYPKVNLIIKEQPTALLIENLENGQIDAAIAATPLETPFLRERPLYYEPFVGYVPQGHRLGQKAELTPTDLEISDILLLQDGHCFREGVLNLCQTPGRSEEERFTLQSGSFETMVNLADEGLGMTLLPYLNTLELDAKKKGKLKYFKDPSPAREVSIIYHEKELKLHITSAIRETIASVVRGAIAFQDVKIISPLNQ